MAKALLTEGQQSKGGQNPPNTNNERPPAPQGSGGQQNLAKRTESNANRLAAAHLLLDRKFSQAEGEHLWGKIAIVIQFDSGEAKEILHEGGGRIRPNEQFI